MTDVRTRCVNHEAFSNSACSTLVPSAETTESRVQYHNRNGVHSGERPGRGNGSCTTFAWWPTNAGVPDVSCKPATVACANLGWAAGRRKVHIWPSAMTQPCSCAPVSRKKQPLAGTTTLPGGLATAKDVTHQRNANGELPTTCTLHTYVRTRF